MDSKLKQAGYWRRTFAFLIDALFLILCTVIVYANLTSTYIFAYDHDFLVYPNNFNQHVRYYKNTFQHGGISMEEMMVPYIVLNPK